MSPALLARSLAALITGSAACSGSTSATAPVDPPPAEPAERSEPDRSADEPAAREPDEAGFADPKLADDPPAAKPATTPEDPALAARVKERFGDACKLERSCGDLLGVDCKSAVDGPYYYVQRSDLKTVATCGGACMGGRCTDCPPKAWTCAVY